ncbi:MAG: dienelactone hydrolase family protein [Betaproteobacteria bacterium]
MGKYIELQSIDEHRFRAYVVEPPTLPRAALVLLQEMDQRHFGWDSSRVKSTSASTSLPGVNAHIRAVAKSYAALGFWVIAPSTFSRGKTGIDYGYRFENPGDRAYPRICKPLQALDSPLVMLDIQAAIAHAKLWAPQARVGLLGFCWGALLAWRAACGVRGLGAAVCYYGGGMTDLPDQATQALCPVLTHFGNDDQWMKASSVKAFADRHAQTAVGGSPVEVLHYDAPYGFDHPGRASFQASSATLAHRRSVEFLATHLAA